MHAIKLAIAITQNNTIHDSIGNTFAVATCKSKQIDKITTYIANSNSLGDIIAELKEQSIESILCKSADYEALTHLECENIQAFRISDNIIIVEDAINAKLNNKLAPIVKMYTCGGTSDY